MPVNTQTLSISPFKGKNTGQQILFSNNPFDFTKPFVPSIKIPSIINSNEENILLTSDEENIFFLQRKLQTNKYLNNETFFESISDLLTSSDVFIKIADDHQNTTTYSSLPIYSSLDYSQRVFKILFFIQFYLNKYENSTEPTNNTNNEYKIKKILFDLKKISLMSYEEFNDFTSKFYDDLAKESHTFKLKMMQIKNDKLKLASK